MTTAEKILKFCTKPRTARQMRDYKRHDDRIPPVAWVLGLLGLALVFGFFPLLSLVML